MVKPHAQLGEVVPFLEAGYCLWVGAGVSRQVASGHAEVKLWEQLTTEMEKEAGVAAPEGDVDLPGRLDRCLAEKGEDWFRGYLREEYYTRLAEGLLSQALECVERDDFVPGHLRAIAALGQLANPIVSFNIEPFSSVLLARPGGPVRLLVQQPEGIPRYEWREGSGRFQRIVYHPHGLATGGSVMTKSQYKANEQSLAFTLAINVAFANTLLIVGMSLNDDYLRQHIEAARTDLREIYWFDSRFPEELADWAARHRITTVRVDWGEFWGFWDSAISHAEFQIAINQSELCAAWYLAVQQAVAEAEGGPLSALERNLSQFPPGSVPPGLASIAEDLAAAGRKTAEPGNPRTVQGRKPRDIERALRNRLEAAGIRPPAIQESF